MTIPEIYLTTARELFTDDSDRDVRDLAYIELLSVIGNRNKTADLRWDQIRTDEKAVVFEKQHFEYNRETFERKEWWEETERYPLTEEHLRLIQRLSQRMQDKANETGVKFPASVFCYVTYGGFYTSGWNASSPHPRFHSMSNSEPKKIIERVTDELSRLRIDKKEKAIEENPIASKLRQKIINTKKQLAKLENDLEYVLKNGKMPTKKKDENTVDPSGIPLDELDLTVRVYNSLKRTGCSTVEDVQSMLQRGPDAMLAIRNFGEASLEEVTSKMALKGYL
jgi:hypothetical protein